MNRNEINTDIPKEGERVERGAQFVKASNKLLDVGCGDGVLSYFVNNKVDKLYGIDNDVNQLEKAKDRGYITKKVDLDKEKFPFKDNTFDVITSFDVIEHVVNPVFLLSESYRVLKPKGTLIISTPNIRFSDHLFTLIFKGTFPKTSLDPALYDGGHLHFFTYKDMHTLLKASGFKRIEDLGIINKRKRGWKGQIVEYFMGEKFMLEFRTPGILITAKK